MADKKVKLYGAWMSPFSKRVEIALKMKGVEYEFIEEDLQNKSPELLRYNPIHQKIPVLLHGNMPVAESQVILEYIDDTWDSGTRLLPQDPYQRALARFWARFIDDKLMPSLFKVFWLGGEEPAIKEAMEYLKIFDKELEGKRFFGGENVGFVDVVAVLIGYWLGIVEEVTGKVVITEEAFPWVCKWKDEFIKCKVVKELLPSRDELGSFLKAHMETIRASASK